MVEAAWSDLHDATPAGWYIGTPVYQAERREWALYDYDAAERAHIGKRSREGTAVAPNQTGVVREIARCLPEIVTGRVPE